MLSRLATRSALQKESGFRTVLELACRSQSTQQSDIQKQISEWEKANQLYYGPDRDHKNFPHPVMAERPPPTRLGFLPAAWFDTLYEKTGVTGPYVLGTGLILTMLSKEIWVVEHQMMDFSIWLVVIYATMKYGKKIAAALDKSVEAHREAKIDKPLRDVRVIAEESIKNAENAVWCAEGQKYLFEAKKENVGLQLEAEYRQRLDKVYQDVRKRLNYQLDIQNTKRAFEQAHMVNWIVDSVVKSITPQQEKDSITRCIADLKSLSAQA